MIYLSQFCEIIWLGHYGAIIMTVVVYPEIGCSKQTSVVIFLFLEMVDPVVLDLIVADRYAQSITPLEIVLQVWALNALASKLK